MWVCNEKLDLEIYNLPNDHAMIRGRLSSIVSRISRQYHHHQDGFLDRLMVDSHCL